MVTRASRLSVLVLVSYTAPAIAADYPLTVCCVRAAVPDLDGFGLGNSDPYCRMYVCPASSGDCERICETSHVQGDNTPTWNYCCNMGNQPATSYIKARVLDADPGSDDDVGTTSFVSVGMSILCAYM